MLHQTSGALTCMSVLPPAVETLIKQEGGEQSCGNTTCTDLSQEVTSFSWAGRLHFASAPQCEATARSSPAPATNKVSLGSVGTLVQYTEGAKASATTATPSKDHISQTR